MGCKEVGDMAQLKKQGGGEKCGGMGGGLLWDRPPLAFNQVSPYHIMCTDILLSIFADHASENTRAGRPFPSKPDNRF